MREKRRTIPFGANVRLSFRVKKKGNALCIRLDSSAQAIWAVPL